VTHPGRRPSTWAAPRAPHLRVRIFPQAAAGGRSRLETLVLSTRAGEVGPGPQDTRLYTFDTPGKRPYGEDHGRPARPPWRGPIGPAAMPGPGGHFDHLAPGDPGFRLAHLYGCVRFALDVWEVYLGRPIPWHFRRDYQRLELLALTDWANAHMGYGYLEVGAFTLPDGSHADYSLNFDVVAHEVGHAMMMSFVWPFPLDRVTPDYEALHEASADWAAMIASLHLSTVTEELLETTRGDLDTANRFNRFAELSSTSQIRMANNPYTMWDFARGWDNEHELALPLIAALFDAFVAVYKAVLLRHGAIPAALDDIAEMAERQPAWRGRARRGFARSYARHPARFHDALAEAREVAAEMLVGLWRRADPTSFRLGDIRPILEDVDLRRFHGDLRPIVADAFRRRGIGIVPPGPRLRAPGADSHLHSVRTRSDGGMPE
jgi:hypothetical protein